MRIIQKYYIIKTDAESDINGGCYVGESDVVIETAREMLKIRVDADACPVNVRRSLERLARIYRLDLIYYIDDSHELYPQYGEVRQVGQSRDAVDLVLVNQTHSHEIVVTQDYGLAALVLARNAMAIHPSGMLYNEHNIDRLLMERHLAARARQAGERFRHSKKRQKGDDLHFGDQLKRLIETSLASSSNRKESNANP